MSAEHDILNAARDLLDATNEFSDIWLPGLDDPRGKPASELLFCGLEPGASRVVTGFDSEPWGAVVYETRIPIEIEVRNADGEIRDETADRLLEVVKNTLDGQSLAGFTFPGKTYITQWQRAKARPPTRRITATLVCQYLEEGWAAGDTTEDF